MPLSPGDVVGHYTIEILLGEGGMGQVFRAHDARLERKVALKIVRRRGESEDAEGAKKRLLQEARAAAALDHPNAVAVFEVGEAAGEAFVAMELVEGQSLRAYIGDPEVSLAVRVQWLADVARALSAAHRRGLVHRDVKPENVMVRTDGVVKVLDFGIARRVRIGAHTDGPSTLTGDADVLSFALAETAPCSERARMAEAFTTLTRAGTVIGTPLYMAPEQMRGEPVDARADQFAWGVVAYELLSGTKPWGDRANLTTFIAMLSAPAPALERVKTVVARAVDRALAKSRTERHASMEEIVAALDPSEPPSSMALRAAPVIVAPAGPITDLAAARELAPLKHARRRRVALAVAGLLLAAGVVTAVTLRVSLSRPGATIAAVPPPPTSAPRHGVAITDLPLPKTTPEALVDYQAGLGALRAGSWDVARESLTKAVEKDPDLGEAWTRLVVVSLDERLDPGVAFANARRLHDRLDDRYRGYLEGIAPIVERTPAEPSEAARRFELLSLAYPEDAEIAMILGWIHTGRSDAAGMVAAADRAIALDPDYGDPWSMKAAALNLMNRFDETRQVAEACFERFGSIDCLAYKVYAEVCEGDVAAVESTSRRILAALPDSGDGARSLASALFERGEPAAALAATRATWRATLDQSAADALDGQLATLRGDFAEAARKFEAASEKAPRTRAAQGDLATLLVETYEEMGDSAARVRVAQRYVGASAAYSIGGVRFDRSLRVARVLVDSGGLTSEDFEKRRAAIVERLLTQYGDVGRVFLWQSNYAVCARDERDAREALDEISRVAPETLRFGNRYLGRMHWLVGDTDRALPELEWAARRLVNLAPGESPREAFRMHLVYGEALEKKGDTAKACAEFAWILTRWGRAVPRSVTADEANKHAGGLRCAIPSPPPGRPASSSSTNRGDQADP